MVKVLFQPKYSAILALIAYGTWAAFSNRLHGSHVVVKAFLAQGSFAFLATLILGSLALLLFNRFGQNQKAAWLSFSFCFSIQCLVPSTLHWLIETPEILTTVAPGLIWGSLYIGILLMNQTKKVAQL